MRAVFFVVIPRPPRPTPRPPRLVFTKRAITFTAQLRKLKDRDLLVADEARALRYLANSYYRLSGYWAPSWIPLPGIFAPAPPSTISSICTASTRSCGCCVWRPWSG